MTGGDAIAGGHDRGVPPGSGGLHGAAPPFDGGEEPTRTAVGLVLAAGRGHRFGTPTKQLEDLAGRPLVAHAVAAAAAAGLERVIVVVGHDGQRVGAVATDAARAAGVEHLEVVHNRDHAAGQATSLIAGIRAAREHTTASCAVVLLADQPHVDPATIGEVVAAVAGGALAARVRYLDGPGHPVAFARACWDRLLDVTGDEGARQVLPELAVVEVARDEPAPVDVDTPEDLAALRAGGEDSPRGL